MNIQHKTIFIADDYTNSSNTFQVTYVWPFFPFSFRLHSYVFFARLPIYCQNIDLIYYTGDFGDHFNWDTSQSSVKHTIEFITQQFKEKFPNIPVIMALGNHDTHPSDA